MVKRQRILQLVPTLSYGDGVGNDVLAIHKILEKNGYDTHIFAENIDKRISKKVASPVRKMPVLSEKDIIIYHLSNGCSLNDHLGEYVAKKIIRYHNITPPEFFSMYDGRNAVNCREGLSQMRELRTVADYCLADSEYNREDLIKAGYDCDIDVLPIVIPMKDYEKVPSEEVKKRYDDGLLNVLFTGRIVPNKKQEDVINAFFHYQKYYNPKSRLFLVGSGEETAYYQSLCEYVKQLGVQNVIFTGHISFEEMLAFYSLADLFLCMSEHEGFCIPLVEAMIFDIPVIAYQGTGVTGTLNGSGFPLFHKRPVETAGVMNYIQTHDEVRDTLIKEQRIRLKDFDGEKVGGQLLMFLQKKIGDWK